MAQENLDIIVSVKDQASKSLDSFRDRLTKTGTTIQDVGKKAAELGRLFAVAGAAISAASLFSVKSASDLGESINAVRVTFGDASDSILAFSETAATAAGLSQRAFNQSVVPIGAQLQNLGFSADAAADSSINLAQRAADMASVFNTSVADALGAIQAGLRGEIDPLERYGVGLSVASVQAYAVANGLIESGEQMDAQTATVARLGLLMEQTSKFQGDFANTSDSLANKMRIVKAQIENLSSQLGNALLPIIERVLEKVSPIITKISEWITNNPKLSETLFIVVAAIGGIMLVVAPLLIALPTLISLFTALSTVAGVLGIGVGALVGWIAIIPVVIAALIALGYGIFQLIKHWDDLSAKVQIAIGAIVFILFGPLAAALLFIITHWERVKTVAIAVFEAIKTALTGAGTHIQEQFNKIVEFLTKAWETIKTIFQFALSFILGLVITVFDALGIDIVARMETMIANLEMAWEVIKMVFSFAMEAIRTAWQMYWDSVVLIFTTIWGVIKTVASAGMSVLRDIINTAGGVIKTVWGAIWGAVGGVVTSAWDNIKNTVRAGINSVIDMLNKFIQAANAIAAKASIIPGVKVPTLPSIPRLAQGGIVTKPTLAMIGEGGESEAVVPLSKANKMGFGGGGMSLHIHIDNSVITKQDQVVELIGDPIVQILKQHFAVT